MARVNIGRVTQGGLLAGLVLNVVCILNQTLIVGKKLMEEQQALYKEYGVNPLGGCLPLLLQFPILIALFAVLKVPGGVDHIGQQARKQLPAREAVRRRCAGCSDSRLFRGGGAHVRESGDPERPRFR